MGGRGGGGGGGGGRVTGTARVGLTDRLTKMYKSGRSLRQIAAETGRSASSVHSILVNNGVPLRARGGRSR